MIIVYRNIQRCWSILSEEKGGNKNKFKKVIEKF